MLARLRNSLHFIVCVSQRLVNGLRAKLWGRVRRAGTGMEGRGPILSHSLLPLRVPLRAWILAQRQVVPLEESCISSTLTWEGSGVSAFLLGLVLLHHEIRPLNFKQTVSLFPFLVNSAPEELDKTQPGPLGLLASWAGLMGFVLLKMSAPQA